LWKRFGTLSWATVLAPAIKLARSGVAVSTKQAESLRTVAPALTPGEGGEAYAPGGQLLQAGQSLRHPGLADTLQQLAEEGAETMYRGDLASEIVSAVASRGGVLTRADLESYRVTQVPAHQATFGRNT